MSYEKLQLRFDAVIERREKQLKNWFFDESKKYQENIIAEQEPNINSEVIECRKNSLISISSDVFGTDCWKFTFTKEFARFYIKELQIKDKLCKNIINKIKFRKNSYRYQNIEKMTLDTSYFNFKNKYLQKQKKEVWDCVEKIFSNYKKIKDLFLNKEKQEKIHELKKELCILTNCYKNPDAIKVICEKCGKLLPIESIQCPECNNEIRN